MKEIRVVAAIINHKNKILIVRTPLDKGYGGLWVFPGGKIEQGEEPLQALSRELREELDLDIGEFKYIDRASHEESKVRINIEFYTCDAKEPDLTPAPNEIAEALWIHPADLGKYPFPPANERVLQTLIAQGVPA